jgi:LysM repeat protein
VKKTLLGFIIVLLAIFDVSCASKPAPAPVPVEEPAPPPPPPPPQVVEPPKPQPAPQKVDQEYNENIILAGAKTYTVVAADTLSKIARKNYGSRNGYYFPLIMLASGKVIADPDYIRPGMKLTIPDLKKNLDDPGARKKLKGFLHEVAKVYEAKGKLETRNRLRALADSLEPVSKPGSP